MGENQRHADATIAAEAPAANAGAPVTARLLGEASTPIWSMSSSELLRRALSRAGVAEAGPQDPAGGPLLLMRADHVYDASLVAQMAKATGTLLLRPEDRRPVAAHLPAGTGAARAEAVARALLAGAPARDPAFDGLSAAAPGEMVGAYDKALRKRGAPYLLELTPESRRAVEWRMFGGAYKGVTDLVTKYAWPHPAFHVVRACAALGITPNQVTALSLILVFAALYWFWQGNFWPGLAAAWVMTFLDTVDGKLARVTLTSTKFGNLFDHLIDLIHPPFWWLAWIAGCTAIGMPLPDPWLAGVIVFGGYVLQRVQEGIFIRAFGMHIHVWRRFDSFFRLIIARRNPNLLLLTPAMLIGRPDLGMMAVVIWTALGCVEQLVVTVQAMLARRRGPLRSWLDA
ncbi:CDP-alcohol phosphatidyltransferase family protein [Roseomonas marmotae]|uniref:CDP-alcohol phosphatidyltransferase family protein n=1 Tax=Roseomonas marmotae TaxID=2768161 RepID=A0ABS3KEG9_9PROT|nr:CDP-alcohol phosphatidyltransferase family protein [Roseomonas marmotae]MBO1075868.1 CDP-alcohol phosphatidyltransferase family protein [Roseomonas marmotae]QTI81943.1 CDP-alcohol phosphatidyltransferase family protein [Roseomonas marmotae]